MKRNVAFLLAMCLALTLFASCASTSQAPASVATDEPASSQAAAPEKEPVELTMWYTSYALNDLELELQRQFMEQNPHITINNVIKEGDPGNDFYTAVAAGNAPDLVPASFTMMDKYMSSDILEPLTPYFNAWAEKGNFDKRYLDAYTKDGNLMGLAGWSAAFYFGYNKALFQQAGIAQPPKTWDEALEDAKKISALGNDTIGYATLTAEWTEWFFQYFVWQAGGDLTTENPDGTLALTFTDPAVIQAGEYYQSLRNAGVLQSDLTLKFPDLLDKFAQGKVGMMPFAGDWVQSCIQKGMKLEDIGIALFPAGPGGQAATTDIGQCWVINAKTTQAKKDAAWEWIKFYLSLDVYKQKAANMVETGAVSLMLVPRTDFDLVAETGMPSEYKAVLDASKGGRLEFAGKAIVGSYVDRAVQSILSNPNADVTTEFEKAQQAAQAEVVNDYNKQAKA